MKLSKYFSEQELRCKDGTAIPSFYVPVATLLALQLDVIRAEIDAPIIVNSCYRTPSHNSKVGGATNSYHLYAMAADIRTQRLTPPRLAAVIERLIEEKRIIAGGIGVYSSFVHYDIRGHKTKFK